MAKRHELQHFIDINMDKTLANPDYHLLGDGIPSLMEDFNPEEETQQWINQANGTTDIKSYTPSISVEMQDIDQSDTDLMGWMYNMIDTLPTGSEAITSYVRVRIKGPGPSYPAVWRECAISVGGTGGDAGENITNSITIGGRGDGIKGTFAFSKDSSGVVKGGFTPNDASTVSTYSAKTADTKANKSGLS